MKQATVVKGGETYGFTCACGFPSTGWATKKAATTRAGEHHAEHETGKPMSELADFEKENTR